MRASRRELLGIGCCLAFVAAGCNRSDGPTSASQRGSGRAAAVDSAQETDVELALNWFPEAEHGGYFAALVHGFYKEAGLNVRILPGGPGSPVLQRVATGRVAFGIENADRVLLARAQEADVVAVMAPLQKSPRAVMVRAASTFKRIEDLSNVTLAVTSGATWLQFLKKKIAFENVRFVPYSGNVAAFLVHADYAQQAYVFSEPYFAKEKGVDVRCLMVADAGYNPYTSVLVTRGDSIRNRPDLVGRFVKASVRGWQVYLDHPEKTNGYIGRINPEIGPEVLAFGAKALRPLCLDGLPGIKAVGRMTAERWKTLAAQMIAADALADQAVDPLRAFNLDFLPNPPGDVSRH